MGIIIVIITLASLIAGIIFWKRDRRNLSKLFFAVFLVGLIFSVWMFVKLREENERFERMTIDTENSLIQ
jgi:uncharacterized membrane protein YqjE